MCGIAAILAPPSASVSPDALDRAVARLHHRGPDGRGRWISPDGRVGLGHARLSIIDLDTGQQPMASEDDRTWITANGEFYDFERIQDELRGAGHSLRSGSDSEIALHLYEDLGPHCLHHLRGEFAFVIWDGRHRQLFAARDRFGVKPLFWARHEGFLYLASEVKALFEAGVPARWDLESVHHGPAFRRPDRTFFEGVKAIPPGHYLLADDQGVRVFQYWDIHYPMAGAHSGTVGDEEAIQGFREVLDESVRLRLRADVPVGCYLSGGLDSCAVLGLAQRHVSRPIRAFTLSFDRAEYDEEAIAREMAEHAGAEFVPIYITQDLLADHLPEAITACETFAVNAHGVAKFLLSRAVRDAGFKVVLTGEGSDEMLAGYPHWRRDMLLYNHQGQDPGEVDRLLEDLAAANQVSRGLLMPEKDSAHTSDSELLSRVLGFVPTWMIPQFKMARARVGVYAPGVFDDVVERDLAAFLLGGLDVQNQLMGRDPVHQSLYLWAKTALPDYILTVLGDRMEMAHSIEGRVAFLDHHVAEYLRTIPVHLKIRGMTEKFILREATRHVLTDTVYRRQKHPFLSPPAALDPSGRLHQLTQDTLRGSAVENVPWLHAPAVRAFMDSVEEMDDAERVATDPMVMWLMSAVFLQEGMGLAS
jgi:asparagine synthase (glutamine-hydrolysing)